jgi:hypothetical protein
MLLKKMENNFTLGSSGASTSVEVIDFLSEFDA